VHLPVRQLVGSAAERSARVHWQTVGQVGQNVSRVRTRVKQSKDKEGLQINTNLIGISINVDIRLNCINYTNLNRGVYGHMEGELPWASCEEPLRAPLAKLVGANVDEVNVMNFLSVNLHIMMVCCQEFCKYNK
jgi:kynureninase